MADKINVENISVNTQSSIRINGTKILYFDPFQIKEEVHDADFVFITHSHQDHLDPDSIQKIAGKKTIYIIPSGIKREMPSFVKAENLILMDPGDEQETGGILISAVPAYNRVKPFHPRRNRWNGYIVTLDGVKYYIAGDTDALKELSAISCDVALVPIGGFFTMNAEEAAKLINSIRPHVAIPTHYGSIVGKMRDAEIFGENIEQGIAVEIKIR